MIQKPKLRKLIINYDRWKLSSPYEKDTVSSCCGTEYSEDNECESCGHECRTIDEDEYLELEKESYLEDRR